VSATRLVGGREVRALPSQIHEFVLARKPFSNSSTMLNLQVRTPGVVFL
jgi:hypothetical protein